MHNRNTAWQHVYNFKTKQSDSYSNGARDALKPTLIIQNRLIDVDVVMKTACITLIQIKETHMMNTHVNLSKYTVDNYYNYVYINSNVYIVLMIL